MKVQKEHMIPFALAAGVALLVTGSLILLEKEGVYNLSEAASRELVGGAVSGDCHLCLGKPSHCETTDTDCSDYDEKGEETCKLNTEYVNYKGYNYWWCKESKDYKDCKVSNQGTCRHSYVCLWYPLTYRCKAGSENDIWSWRECDDMDGHWPKDDR